jgi:hypothetical protein
MIEPTWRTPPSVTTNGALEMGRISAKNDDLWCVKGHIDREIIIIIITVVC